MPTKKPVKVEKSVESTKLNQAITSKKSLYTKALRFLRQNSPKDALDYIRDWFDAVAPHVKSVILSMSSFSSAQEELAELSESMLKALNAAIKAQHKKLNVADFLKSKGYKFQSCGAILTSDEYKKGNLDVVKERTSSSDLDTKKFLAVSQYLLIFHKMISEFYASMKRLEKDNPTYTF